MGHKLEGRRRLFDNQRRRERKPWRVRIWLPCARIDLVECDTQAEAFAVTVKRTDGMRFEVFGPDFYKANDGPIVEGK
jgi:hypothetical protein